MPKKKDETLGEPDVLDALAENQHILNEIPSRQTQVRVTGTDQNIFVSIFAPDIGFEWSLTVPRKLAGHSPGPIVAMEMALYSLRNAIAESFPKRHHHGVDSGLFGV